MQALGTPKTGPVLVIGEGFSMNGHSKLAMVRSACCNSPNKSWKRLAASPASKYLWLPSIGQMSAPMRIVGMIGIATGKLCRLTVAELCFLKKLLVQDVQSAFAIVSSDEARNPNLRRKRHVDWNFLS